MLGVPLPSCCRFNPARVVQRISQFASSHAAFTLRKRAVTIFGLWSHCGTGEEWADGDNSMTSADAQAFKRACSCFGLGRYFYDFQCGLIWTKTDR